MRKTLAMAALAVSALTATTISASAWECTGPAFACGGGSSSKASTESYSAPSKKKVAAHKASSSKRSYSVASDEGGSGGYSGKASYYWEPQRTASGGWFNPNAMTAAHKTLPFGTKVRVTNRSNGKSVVVTINDRGPYVAGRVIDLSRAAAQAISMTGAGVAPVTYTVLGKG